MVRKVKDDSVKKDKVGSGRRKAVSYAEKVAVKKLKKEVKGVAESAKQDTVAKKNVAIDGKGVKGDSKTVKKNKVNDIRIKGVKIVAKTNDTTSRLGKVVDGKIRATGRRKTAIAKVALAKNDGDKNVIFVNGLEYNKFFTKLTNQKTVCSPFVLLGINKGYVVDVVVLGGGKTGQADASKLGLSKCLAILSDDYCKILKKNSFLTRDAREVEQKKAGLKKARKKEQFSKR